MMIANVCLSSHLVSPILHTQNRASISKPSLLTNIYHHVCKPKLWSCLTTHKLHNTHYGNRHPATSPGRFSWEHEQKIDEVRKWLLEIGQEEEENPTEILVFVDTIQRLGVSHHFREEIQEILRQHYEATGGCKHGLNNLHDVALSFRLLRQHGHHVSPDVFEIFKGEDGNYKYNIQQDIKGLLELYEAAQLSFEGEHELDKAANFSKHILNESLANSKYNSTVGFRLSHPYHMSIEGLPDTYFLKDLININERSESLKELLEMDLDARKSAYQREVVQLSKWWKDLEISSELDLLRDQPVKWYAWSMTALVDDIGLSSQRIGIAKSIALIYLIDDIFDIYGTQDELKIFTQAVNKWDYAAIETLPDYMKNCYKALLDTTNEIAYNINEDYRHNPVNSLKSTWVGLCDAFLVEAEWFASGKQPTAEAYLENGKVSSGAYVVSTHLFFLLGLGGTQCGSVNLNDITKLASSAATILRLWDDVGFAMDEDQEGIDGSYLEFYMEGNKGATVAQARGHVKELIESEWKRLNKECFELRPGSALPFKNACLNLARMIPLTYNADDDNRVPVIKEYVYSMLFNQKSLD